MTETVLPRREADFTRTCEGCEHVGTELWPKRGSYKEQVTAYRCLGPGRCRGYHIGTERFLPYVPAWCPKMEREDEGRTHG